MDSISKLDIPLSMEDKIKKAREYLENRNPIIFMADDYFGVEFFEMCKDTRISNLSTVIGIGEDFAGECECSKCGNITNFRVSSKTRLVEIAKEFKKDKYICDTCKKVRDKERENEYKEYEEKRTKRTQRFIDEYLEVGFRFEHNTKKLFWEVHNFDVSRSVVAEHIKEMPYRDFLDTPYWSLVSWYAKARAGFKCKLCNSQNGLQTHHRTYDNHGYELYRWNEDLIVLCESCHQHFHDNGGI